MNKRKLWLWERNWLMKHEMGEIDIDEYGEIPVEYITGFCQFYGHEFVINKNTLISRIETEELMEIALKICPKKKKILIADVGTGNGCIGISLFLELKKLGIGSEAYLSDISEEALEVARENIVRLISQKGGSLEETPHEAKVCLIKSDLMSDYPKNLKFDLIVANLPYIPSARMEKLPESVKNYEPRLALDGGKDGLVLIKKLLKQLPQRLDKNGVAILEIDETHRLEDFRVGEIKKDQFGKNRFLVLRW